MHRELWKADRELRELSIESSFQQIHHFSSERFASSPSTLHQFEKYSEGVSDFEDGENAQTIRRALAVVENVRDGRRDSRCLANFPACHEIGVGLNSPAIRATTRILSPRRRKATG